MNIDQSTIDAMDRLGGSFVKSLAECYLRADPYNKAKLYEAFQAFFDRYEKMAKNSEAST